MREILGIGGIDPRRVSDALRIRGHDSGHKGQACTYQRDPSHNVTCGFTGKKWTHNMEHVGLHWHDAAPHLWIAYACRKSATCPARRCWLPKANGELGVANIAPWWEILSIGIGPAGKTGSHFSGTCASRAGSAWRRSDRPGPRPACAP